MKKNQLILSSGEACVLANKKGYITSGFGYREVKVANRKLKVWVAVGDTLSELIMVSSTGEIMQIYRQQVAFIHRTKETFLRFRRYRLVGSKLVR